MGVNQRFMGADLRPFEHVDPARHDRRVDGIGLSGHPTPWHGPVSIEWSSRDGSGLTRNPERRADRDYIDRVHSGRLRDASSRKVGVRWRDVVAALAAGAWGDHALPLSRITLVPSKVVDGSGLYSSSISADFAATCWFRSEAAGSFHCREQRSDSDRRGAIMRNKPISKLAVWIAFFVAFALFRGGLSLAGPNAGGTLLVHKSSTAYTDDEDAYCEDPTLPSACEDVITEHSGSSIAVMVVYASFPEGSSPRLAGLTFGVDYPSGGLRIVDFGHCGQFELPNGNWPEPGSGTAVTFSPVRTGTFEEIYWFAAYDPYLSGEISFDLVAHPTQGGSFGDDATPSNIDPIRDFGRLGFNGDPGYAYCAVAAGACCFADGRCEFLTAEECAVEQGDFQGAGSGCAPNPCPQLGACCFPDGSCVLLVEWECGASGGTFVGPDMMCEPNPCPLPGACCDPDGNCERVLPEWCAGEYLGNGTVCDPNPCSQPAACCYADGHCVMLQMQGCQDSGGEYQGDGTICDPNPCPQFPGACCFPDGECVVLAEYLCGYQGGVYLGPDTACDANPCPNPGACCFPDGHCTYVPSDVCHESGGEYQGDDSNCDPSPCPEAGACCFGDDSCQMSTATSCASEGGEFHPGIGCSPNPCFGIGACCVGADCVQLTSAECFTAGGVYMGEDVPCEDVDCVVYDDCLGELFTLAELGFRGPLMEQPGPVAASTGISVTTLLESEDGGCGAFFFNTDGTYEDGYAWRYGGTVPPFWGAFAERYTQRNALVCAAVFDFYDHWGLGRRHGHLHPQQRGGTARLRGVCATRRPGPDRLLAEHFPARFRGLCVPGRGVLHFVLGQLAGRRAELVRRG